VAEYKRPAEVVDAAQATLDATELGRQDFMGGDRPARRIAGLRNVVVWGRAVTNVLQNLRTFDRGRFDTWYEPYRVGMEHNPTFQYLYQLRTQVLKHGTLGGTKTSMHIEQLGPAEFARLQSNPPPNARGFFIGDTLGGSGWIVALPDGSEERYYVDIPGDIRVTVSTQFADATHDMGIPPPLKPIDQVLGEYVDYLSELVAAARKEFAT